MNTKKTCHRYAIVNFVFFLTMMSYTGETFSIEPPDPFIRKTKAEIQSAADDSLKVDKLFQLACYYFDILGDNRLADSLSESAIHVAEKSYQPALIFEAYNRYLECNDLRGYYKKALDYATRAEQISSETTSAANAFRLYKNFVSVYLAGYSFDKALEYSYKLLSNAGTSDNLLLRAQSYLLIGQSLEGKNQKIEAFRNYLNAAGIAEKINDAVMKIQCYDRLSDFFNLIRLYPKATHYKMLQRNLILAQRPVDSVALAWTAYDLLVIGTNQDNQQMRERDFEDILDFAVRTKQYRLLKYQIGLMRKHYIEENEIDRLFQLYTNRFSGELVKLAAENPALYYRLKAFFSEENNRGDSALFWLNKAEVLIQDDPNKINQSNFFYRFGQFLLRNDRQELAIEKFTTSFEQAREAFYIDYMLNAVKQLESIYSERGDYKNAYKYAILDKALNDSINNISKKDQLLIMEIDHETRQREIAAENDQQTTLRRHNLQYSAIIIGILTAFVVLIMLGSLKVPAWIIRMLGFFSFIFLFEFIILLADHKIHDFTHGEPWKILLIKIGLIAILLPLHHRIEKLVISYLLSHKLLNINHLSFIKKAVKSTINKKNLVIDDEKKDDQQ